MSIEKKKSSEAKNEGTNPIFDSRVKILVVGIGGGGSSIVFELAKNVKRANFILINTDNQALQALKGLSKNLNLSTLLIGKELFDGLGTGMDVEKGEKAALESEKEIKEVLKGYDLIILVSCLGGGTGTGAISIINRISKELGSVTYGIFTYPFDFEGEKRKKLSNMAINKIKKEIDSFSLVLNQKIFDFINKETSIEEAFSLINKKLNKSLNGLINTISEPGLINTDWADLQTIFRQKRGLSYLNSIDIDTESLIKIDTPEDFSKLFLSGSIYSYGIENSSGVLLNIFTKDNISLSHINKISSSVSNLVDENAKIIIGINDKKNISNIMLLAVGCNDEILGNNEDSFSFETSTQSMNYNNVRKREAINDDSYWDIPTFIRKGK